MFKIIWSDDAIRQLEVMLRIGSKLNRRGITRAVQEIEIALRDNPDQVGESRPDGRRISYCSPLAYYFRVNVRLKTVLIDHLWPIVWYW